MSKRKAKPEDEAAALLDEDLEPTAFEPDDHADAVNTADDAPRELTPQGDHNEYRTEERISVHVKAVVQFREGEEENWKEIVDITTISKNGAALQLSRECPVGRLISMALQMPEDLRVYDFSKDVYPMLGVVQNCSSMVIDGKAMFQVGVAFIGKKMPDSYKADPKQSYRITGRTPLGLWQAKEATRQFVNRKAARFWRRFEVALSIRDLVNKETRRFRVFTRDISVGGMSVWGPVDAKIGDRVKVTSREYDFYGMAIVRNRTESTQAPDKSMIHFEFDGCEFPISKIDKPHNHPINDEKKIGSPVEGLDDADADSVSYS